MNREFVERLWVAAEDLLAEGNLLQAIQVLHGMLSLSPQRLHEILGLGRLQETNGSSWPTALMRHEVYTRLRISTVLVEYTTNYEDAKRILTPALSLFQRAADLNVFDKARVYRTLGVIYQQKRKLEGAIDMYEKSINTIREVTKKSVLSPLHHSFIGSLLIEYYKLYIEHQQTSTRNRPLLQAFSSLESCLGDFDCRKTLTKLKIVEALMRHNMPLARSTLKSFESLHHKEEFKSEEVGSFKKDEYLILSDSTVRSSPFSVIPQGTDIDSDSVRSLFQYLLDDQETRDESCTSCAVPVRTIGDIRFNAQENNKDSGQIRTCRIPDSSQFSANLLKVAILLGYRYKYGLTKSAEAMTDSLKSAYFSTKSNAVVVSSNASVIREKHFDHVLFRVVDKYLLAVDEMTRRFASINKIQGRKLHQRHIETLAFLVGSKIHLNAHLTLLDLQQLSFRRALRRIYVLSKLVKSYPKGILKGAQQHIENVHLLIAVFSSAVNSTSVASKHFLAYRRAYSIPLGTTQNGYASMLPTFHERATTHQTFLHHCASEALGISSSEPFTFQEREKFPIIAGFCYQSLYEQTSTDIGTNKLEIQISPPPLRAVHLFYNCLQSYQQQNYLEMLRSAEEAADISRRAGNRLLHFRILAWTLSRPIETEEFLNYQMQKNSEYVQLHDQYEKALNSLFLKADSRSLDHNSAQVEKELMAIESFE